MGSNKTDRLWTPRQGGTLDHASPSGDLEVYFGRRLRDLATRLHKHPPDVNIPRQTSLHFPSTSDTWRGYWKRKIEDDLHSESAGDTSIGSSGGVHDSEPRYLGRSYSAASEFQINWLLTRRLLQLVKTPKR